MKITSSPPVLVLDDPNVRDYYICGDLHGMKDVLMQRLREIGFNPVLDRLICSGDLVDRGSRSKETALLLKELWFLSSIGNHEAMLLNALAELRAAITHRGVTEHRKNGGYWFYSLDWDEMLEIETLLLNLPYAIEIHHRGRKYGVVHADVMGSDWNNLVDRLNGRASTLNWLTSMLIKQDVYQHTIWSRERFNCDPRDIKPIKGVDAVFVGHNITPHPFRQENMYYLDTGCYATGKLTIVKLDEDSMNKIPAVSMLGFN